MAQEGEGPVQDASRPGSNQGEDAKEARSSAHPCASPATRTCFPEAAGCSKAHGRRSEVQAAAVEGRACPVAGRGAYREDHGDQPEDHGGPYEGRDACRGDRGDRDGGRSSVARRGACARLAAAVHPYVGPSGAAPFGDRAWGQTYEERHGVARGSMGRSEVVENGRWGWEAERRGPSLETGWNHDEEEEVHGQAAVVGSWESMAHARAAPWGVEEERQTHHAHNPSKGTAQVEAAVEPLWEEGARST